MAYVSLAWNSCGRFIAFDYIIGKCRELEHDSKTSPQRAQSTTTVVCLHRRLLLAISPVIFPLSRGMGGGGLAV